MKFRSTPLPACRNGVLFDNSLNDKRFRIDIRVENGYEEGCTRGAIFSSRRRTASGGFFMGRCGPAAFAEPAAKACRPALPVFARTW